MTTRLAVIFLTLALSASAQTRVYFDRAHGQLPLPPKTTDVTKKLNLDIAIFEQPITPEALKTSRLPYLRAPSKTFTIFFGKDSEVFMEEVLAWLVGH